MEQKFTTTGKKFDLNYQVEVFFWNPNISNCTWTNTQFIPSFFFFFFFFGPSERDLSKFRSESWRSCLRCRSFDRLINKYLPCPATKASCCSLECPIPNCAWGARKVCSSCVMFFFLMPQVRWGETKYLQNGMTVRSRSVFHSPHVCVIQTPRDVLTPGIKLFKNLTGKEPLAGTSFLNHLRIDLRVLPRSASAFWVSSCKWFCEHSQVKICEGSMTLCSQVRSCKGWLAMLAKSNV